MSIKIAWRSLENRRKYKLQMNLFVLNPITISFPQWSCINSQLNYIVRAFCELLYQDSIFHERFQFPQCYVRE